MIRLAIRLSGSELDRAVWPTIVREQGARHTLDGGALVLPTYGAGVNGVPRSRVPDVASHTPVQQPVVA